MRTCRLAEDEDEIEDEDDSVRPTACGRLAAEGVLDGLILFSHGSVLCGAGEALESHAARLRESGDWAAVEIGYLNYSRPTFAEAVGRIAASGIRRVTIVPYFLVPGYFVTSSLPREVVKARTESPGLEFSIAEPIGYDDSLADAMLELAENARGPESWRKDLARAAEQCETNPRCPLFGTPRCPMALALQSEGMV